MADGRFAGRVAIVSGGATGVGAAAALRFAREGAAVGVIDRNAPRAREVAAAITAAGGRCAVAEADVGDKGALRLAIKQLTEVLGDADILFNHAGTVEVKPFLETTADDWHRLLAINLLSMVHATQAVLPAMLARGRGVIVNTASISGLTCAPLESVYCVTKAACIQLTRAVAVEFRDRGIRCNAVAPGFIGTPHGRRELADLAAYGEPVADADIARLQGRVCTPDEVAGTILFLASDDAAFVNGECLTVDNAAMAAT